MIDGYGGAKGRRVPLAAAANQAHLNRKLLSEAPVLRFIKYQQLDWPVKPRTQPKGTHRKRDTEKFQAQE